ncbi:Intersectin 1 (SH3 domain protein) [Rhizoclosmatium sp. JEL0117]|nr:Intersectin 1 (SH3 domain protein) [Rhizoclosmatium sp. JEL0117]
MATKVLSPSCIYYSREHPALECTLSTLYLTMLLARLGSVASLFSAGFAIKKSQQTQLSKLQYRAEGNLEVLNELRAFMKEKARLDDEYGRGLEKLASAKSMQSKKFRRGPTLSGMSGKSAANLFKDTFKKPRESKGTGPDVSHQTPEEEVYVNEDGSSVRAIYTTYLALITESERMGKARAYASDRTANEISEFLKDYTKERNVSLRKTMDFAIKYQQELHTTYDDLEKMKLAYERAAKETETAKRKYEETAKKPNSGFNALKNAVSGMDGEERVELLRQKWKSLDARLAEARNDYLLAIASVNSQQSQYYSHDLSTWMKKFDNDFHAVARNMFAIHTELETSLAQSITDAVGHIRVVCDKIDHKIDTETFVFDNAQLFADPKPYIFEAYPGDRESDIVVNDTSKVVLGHKLAHLQTQSDEIASALAKKTAEHAGVKQLAATYAATPQFGNAMATADQLLDLENSMDILICVQRRLTVQIAILERANIAPIKNTDVVLPTRGLTSASNLSSRFYVAVYGYETNEEGELAFAEGEELTSESIESNGWLLVTSKRTGRQGLVPFNYIKEIVTGSPTITSLPRFPKPTPASSAEKVQALYDYAGSVAGELTFSAGDIITITNKNTGSADWWEGEGPRGKGQFPVSYVKQLTNGSRTSSVPTSPRLQAQKPRTFRVKALYDYSAGDAGELSFSTAEVIEVLDSSDNDWWNGRLRGAEGLFPASYVERI